MPINVDPPNSQSSPIKSIQRGITHANSGEVSFPTITNVGISEVNTAKTMVNILELRSNTNSNPMATFGVDISLVSGTVLRITNHFYDLPDYKPIWVSWEIIEFY